jgi:RNA polymerase sigma factor (sigma-70 family)
MSAALVQAIQRPIVKTLFAMTVDTEEEWSWGTKWPTRGLSVNNIRNLPRFQQLCNRHGVAPTYFVNLAVLDDPGARDTVMIDSEAVERAADGIDTRDVETPETRLMRASLTPEVQAAVDGLPDAFREAVWLRDVEEFSYAEIARILAVPVGTVMSRISRGRRLLFERLQHLKPANV